MNIDASNIDAVTFDFYNTLQPDTLSVSSLETLPELLGLNP